MVQEPDKSKARSLADLRDMTEAELISEHDRIAPTTGVSVNYFLNELNRSDQDRQTKAMLRYTKWITAMTFVVTAGSRPIEWCKSTSSC
jgi:hypothetical protein